MDRSHGMFIGSVFIYRAACLEDIGCVHYVLCMQHYPGPENCIVDVFLLTWKDTLNILSKVLVAN